MNYLYGPDGDYSDFAPGRVLRGGPGFTHFPVRLGLELFGRCAAHLGRETGLSIYDPCCGAGSLLTVLGFIRRDKIAALIGSDCDERAVGLARANLSLLTRQGLQARREELLSHYAQYGRGSYRQAADSTRRLESLLERGDNPDIRVFQADALDPVSESRLGMGIEADMAITDVPYGGLTAWQGEGAVKASGLLDSLAPVLKPGGAAAICSDKDQSFSSPLFRRVERHNVGKRQFALYIKL